MDIDSTDDPIHAGQIFAEMLVAISHPEFNSLEQEVRIFSLQPQLVTDLCLGIRRVQ